MKYRKFRDTEVSEIGLGTWQLGSADWGSVNEDDAFAILKAFVDGVVISLTLLMCTAWV